MCQSIRAAAERRWPSVPWVRMIYVDDETGGQFVTRAYDMPDVVFATTVRYFVPGDYGKIRAPSARAA